MLAAKARLRTVRRFLVIVLLALLPLQFSWAAVASYCGHETPAQAAHFGHHDHQHAVAHPADLTNQADPHDTADAPPGDDTAGVLDLDCGHCHGHCGVVFTGLPVLPAVLPATLPQASLKEAGAACAPARPERPQWRPLA